MADNVGQKLYGIWKRRYREYHGLEYRGNVYRDSAILRRICEDIGEVQLFELINFYFDFRQNNTIEDLMLNYDRIMNEKDAYDQDQNRREVLKKNTKKKMKELGIDLEED